MSFRPFPTLRFDGFPKEYGGEQSTIVTNFLVNLAQSGTGAVDQNDDPNGLYWNNMNYSPGSISNIVDTENNSSDIGLNISDAGSGSNDTNGRSPSDGVYPNGAWASYYFSENAAMAISITGLNNDATYDIIVGASRNVVSATRVGEYSVDGNATIQTLDAALDPPETITFSSISPASSSIVLDMIDEASSQYVYINFIKIVQTVVGVAPPESEPTLWDAIAALADWGFAPFRTSSNEGGAYEDTAYTTLATNNSEVQGFKGFGNDLPNVPNFVAVRAAGDPSTADLWYASEGSYPLFITDTNEGNGFIRIRNGFAIEYTTDPGSVSPAITASPNGYSEFTCIRVKPGALNERSGHWKEQNGSAIEFFQATPVILTGTSFERFKWSKLYFTIDNAGNYIIELNGTQIDSGTGSLTSISEWLIGANGHAIEHDFAFTIMKYGVWSAGELATIEANAESLYPNSFPTYPYYDTIHILTSSQFDGTGKIWDINRNKTVTFGGGSGTEGTSTYQWYYHDDAVTDPFPANSTLDSHFAFPGADGQNSTLERAHYEAGNGRGNPTLFNNPGSAPYMRVMCVITPKDSLGVEGDKIVTDWTLDNIA